MLKIGLTGGVASGKSTVAQMFRELSIEVFDADNIVHELMQPGEFGHSLIKSRFNDQFFLDSGELDRKRFRVYIFDHPEERQWLESRIHPQVRHLLNEYSDNADGPYCVLMVPLLAESDQAQQLVDRVCVVEAPQSIRIERLCARDHISDSQAQAILKAQTSDEVRQAIAHDLIINNNGLDYLRRQVAKLDEYYRQLVEDTK